LKKEIYGVDKRRFSDDENKRLLSRLDIPLLMNYK